MNKIMPLEPDQLKSLLNQIAHFAETTPRILAAALCGSYARGSATPASDIDLVFIVEDQNRFKETNWLEAIDLSVINTHISSYLDRSYGQVWSRHLYLQYQQVLEFTFACSSWTSTDPIDPGTLKVVQDGFHITYDPMQLLTSLVRRCLR